MKDKCKDCVHNGACFIQDKLRELETVVPAKTAVVECIAHSPENPS